MTLEALVRSWVESARAVDGRFVVLVAGAPGSGKSTFAELVVELVASQGPLVQALPMDGFHLPNSELEKRTVEIDGTLMPLSRVKGAPESFDLDRLLEAVRRLVRGDSLRWPVYDRGLHEPVDDALEVIDRGLVVIEGNYLLLDEPGWRELAPLARERVFLECSEGLARTGLISRHVRGGRSRDDAQAHYTLCDLRNRRRVNSQRSRVDRTVVREELSKTAGRSVFVVKR